MNPRYLIGIDIGTQGTKAALFDEYGACKAEAFIKSNLIRPEPGAVEEDPEEQVDAVCRGIHTCVDESGIAEDRIAAIGIDGQMAGIMGIGEDGRNVTPYDSWLDTRCSSWIKQMEETAGERILRKTGGPPSFNHGPKILWWKNEQPETYKRIHSFIQPGGYAVMRLCGMRGDRAFIDTSYLHFSGFADNPGKVWDKELLRAFDVGPEKMPRIADPHEVIGEIIPEMAELCGIPPGVPLIAGCGDTAASFLSCGATEEGICVDVAGTASVFATTTKEMQPDTKRILGCSQSVVPGLWHPYAYINGGGMNLEWFRREISGSYSFDKLNTLAEQVDADGKNPLFLPHMGGRVCPGMPSLRGAWLDLTWDHSTGHLYRAVLEGIALEYGIYMKTLKELYQGFSPKEIRITGGGEKSQVWNRMKADVLGIPVVQLTRTEGAPLGSALLAGFGIGLYRDLGTAAAGWIEKGNRTNPDLSRRDYCDSRVERYDRFLQAINRISETT